MRVQVITTTDDLERDLRGIPAKSVRDMKKVVRQAGIIGNTVAKDNARRTEGKHGKHYHKSFTVEHSSFYGFGGGEYVAIYGPDASRPQGGMSFEWGSRNQKPHLDLNKSADLIAPAFAKEVRDLPDGWFW